MFAARYVTDSAAGTRASGHPAWLYRVGGDAQQAAAVLALGHCSAEAHALLFEELHGLADEYASDRTKARELHHGLRTQDVESNGLMRTPGSTFQRT